MASGSSSWQTPALLNLPPLRGRKPPTIPDTTQFPDVTRKLFGVTCTPPNAPYRLPSRYNELYLLHLHVPPQLESSVPKKVLARVSRDDKTRSDISLESEIATMVFLKWKTSLPVPTVYGYCPHRDNAIGQPFSIISFAEGVDMAEGRWDQLPPQIKQKTIREYARIVLQLARLHFDRIGSIYFKPNAAPPNCFTIGPISWRKHETVARQAVCPHDRGPWRSSSLWLRAALANEVDFMERLPEIAQSTYGHPGNSDLWRLARHVFPKFQELLTDIIEDPLDQCGFGPFVLGHMDLNPCNIIYTPDGQNAGQIVAVIDWEMCATVPLWQLVCYPSWFEFMGSGSGLRPRDPAETRGLRDAYIRELQRCANVSGSETDYFILGVVQNSRAERKKRFSDLAVLPWDHAAKMELWLRKNRYIPG